MTTNDTIKTEAGSIGTSGQATAQISRRGMLKGSGAMLAALGLAGAAGLATPSAALAAEQEGAPASRGSKPKPRIVLVHGAWADATGWQELIPLLEKEGCPSSPCRTRSPAWSMMSPPPSG